MHLVVVKISLLNSIGGSLFPTDLQPARRAGRRLGWGCIPMSPSEPPFHIGRLIPIGIVVGKLDNPSHF